MKRMLKVLAGVALFAVAAGIGFAVADNILHPQFTPEKGTFDKPGREDGRKERNPWSVTTVAAAVDGKPLPGKVVTLVGEIVDYLLLPASRQARRASTATAARSASATASRSAC